MSTNQDEDQDRSPWGLVAGGLALLALAATPFLALACALGLLFLAAAASQEESPETGEIPPVVMEAYVAAVEQLGDHTDGCTGMTWALLAGIGKIESGHASGTGISGNGDTVDWIIGPLLDGSGAGGNTTPFYDTDDGRWDRNTEYDAAVGPMQFIPTSWEAYGVDGNGDGTADPHNVFDATLAAGVHLCGTGPVDLSDREVLREAIFGYNRSEAYVAEVLLWMDRYSGSFGGGGEEPVTPGPGPGPWGGHQNGQIPADELCPIPWDPGELLRCDATSGLTSLNEGYRAQFGVDLPLTDTYRTYQEQVALKAHWCARGLCHMAAEPGTSNHGWGLAIDFAGPIGSWGTREHLWMKANAPGRGWHNPMWAQPGLGKEEPWHWEWGQS